MRQDLTGDLDFSFAELPAWVQLWGLFAPDCRLRLSPQAAAAGASGALELKLLRHGGPLPLERAFVSVGALRGSVSVTMGGHDNRAEIGPDCVGSFDLKLWRNSEIVIGAGTSSNYVKIVLADSTVHIGRDCMISDEVLIQSTDQHGLIDAETLRVLNGGARRVVLEDHVWLGRRTTVMPDVKIGFGSVIGTGAVVTKDVPPMSVAVGVPAQVVRSGTTWSRSPDGASMAETALIQAWLAAQGG